MSTSEHNSLETPPPNARSTEGGTTGANERRRQRGRERRQADRDSAGVEMSSDEEQSSSASEEEDTVADLPEIDDEERAKIAARGGKRRFSVSSESASSVKYDARAHPRAPAQAHPHLRTRTHAAPHSPAVGAGAVSQRPLIVCWGAADCGRARQGGEDCNRGGHEEAPQDDRPDRPH